MAAIAGSLVTRLGLDSKNFQSGLKTAEGSVKSFTGSVLALFNPLNLSLDSIVAKAVAAGLSIGGIGSRLGALANIADKAAQTGMSGKFLQQLGYAAEQSGVPFDSMMSAMERMNVILGDAARGDEGASAMLEKMGLNAAELLAMTPEDRFMAIADAIAAMPTPAEKASASVDLFGRSLSEMGLLLSEGQRGLRALMAEAENLKIGFSEEDLSAVAKADDAIVRMQTVAQNLLSQISVGMAPVFEQMSNSLTEILPKIGEIARGISEGVADSMKKLGAIVNENVMPHIKAFLETTADLVGKWSAMEGRWKFLADFIGAAFGLGFEMVKAHWSQMLDDMLSETAKKAKELMRMLNPKEAAAALADWTQGYDWEGTKTPTVSSLDLAQAKFENVMRRLEGKEELPLPVVGKRMDGTEPVTEDKRQSVREAMQRAGLGGMFAAPTAPNDPMLKATEEQTKRLERAITSGPTFRVTVVPEF